MAEESPKTRQENELAILEAIYYGDLKDLRKRAAWGQWTPLNLSIFLKPQQGNSGPGEDYVHVSLHVICKRDYPESVPDISLENARGLSQTHLVELQVQLEEKAKSLMGEVMILQLAQHVQEFLHLHNKPASKSFYEEMNQRIKEQREKDLQAKQMEENRQRQLMFEEVQRRQEMLKSEPKLRNRYNSENSDEPGASGGDRKNSASSDSLEEESGCPCEHRPDFVIEFPNREILRLQCFYHTNNRVVYYAMDKTTRMLLSVSEWTFDLKKNNLDLAVVLKNLSSIEQEINYLTRLKHRNLARYLGMKYEHVEDKQIVVCSIARKFYLESVGVGAFLEREDLDVRIQKIRKISGEVLRALDYLHKNNVTHKDIKKGCVYLNRKGEAVLCNHSVYKRLKDLPLNSNLYNKKTDVLQFGHFVKSLLLDEDGEIPRSLPPELLDLLTKCLDPNEKERSTTSQLLGHPFYLNSLAVFSPKHKCEEVEYERNISPDAVQTTLDRLQSTSGKSRLEFEFEALTEIGKGGFGKVHKARNKLDGRFYAIKKIKLNPKNRQLNKKSLREVKLLSRLNHENVVRYYNSWIEEYSIDGGGTDSPTTESSVSFASERIRQAARRDEFSVDDRIEDLAPPLENMEVSISFDGKSQMGGGAFDETSDEDSSDEEGVWGQLDESSQSDGIEFLHEENSAQSVSQRSTDKTDAVDNTTNNDCDDATNNTESSNRNVKHKIQYMYIQMEFCERNTLRSAIDAGLYKDNDRMWRLFREIVDGLAHIHQQGIIHRDLKPVNIFLDSAHHVKIGDFGLATTNRRHDLSSITDLANLKDGVAALAIGPAAALGAGATSIGEQSKTGLVGTTLYVAPELGVGSKAFYNDKVDIYSLGIIFFEMCYKPLPTQMERVTILGRLRSKDIIVPEDLAEDKKILVRLLLDHDVSKRPTAQELLESDKIPPPVVEVRKLQESVRNMLSDPKRKEYKYLIASCFEQTLTPAEDITYDRDPSIVKHNLQLYDFVKRTAIKVFKRHGGQNLATPLLMPKSKYHDGIESSVKLMSHFGGIVTLPHDLRVPFARYVAWNGITSMRRYSIERVYREKKVFGFAPRELCECAFDIVTTSSGHFATDAELLYIVHEIFTQLPVIKNKNCVIHLNHTSLLKAILMHYGVKAKHKELFQLTTDFKHGRASKDQLQSFLSNCGLSDSSVASLINILSTEYEMNRLANQFQAITKKRSGESSALAKQAIHELKTIASNAEAFGVTYPIRVAPGAVNNIHMYSGMVCKFVCEFNTKHHKHGTGGDDLAMGGRYDSTIAAYRQTMQDGGLITTKDGGGGTRTQSAVGISITLDKIVQRIQRALQSQQEEKDDVGVEKAIVAEMSAVDVAVCSVGTKPMIKEKTKILQNLWSSGIKSVMIETNKDAEIEEQWAELKAPHMILLKESDPSMACLRTKLRENRIQEKTMKLNEVLEILPKIVKDWNESAQDQSASSAGAISRSESKIYSSAEKNEQHNDINVSILFVTQEKLSTNARKRHDNQIRSNLDDLFKKLKGYITVLGLSLDSRVVRTIASHLEYESEQLFHRSSGVILAIHPRHKKHLADVLDKIYEEKTKKTDPIVVLFSLPDSFYKIIT